MRVSYYPGCSLHGTAKEYDLSVRTVSRALGIELEEIEDWSCCGATAAHSTNFKLSVALPARDIIAAEKKPQDVMIPCAACFNRFKTAEHHLRQDEALRAEIEGIVGGSYQGSVAIRNPIDIICRDIGLEALRARVVKPLAGLRPVSYYGCLLLRPPDVCRFDDAENPVLLDRIMGALGAEVRPWSFKTDCCGGSLTISKTPIVVEMVDRLMDMAREAGANCLATACPVCMANLDMRASAGRELPVFYFTELAALAMGQEGPQAWFGLHRTDPRPLMKELGLV